MRVLFVSGGNSKNFRIAPFIKAQGDSVAEKGVEVLYYPVVNKGISGYLRNARNLKKFIKENPVDIIHAHYTLSGWVAVLAFTRKPIVLSLMGSDAYGEYTGYNKIKFSSRFLTLLTYLIQPFVNSIICKSKHIESFVYLKKKSHIIPNGIMLEKIQCNENGFRKELNLNPDMKYILFSGNKNEIRKNFRLAEDAVNFINSGNIVLLAPYPVSHQEIARYMNSADVVAVPSFMEGSPNVVKEAMACNCPVVATDVGDVSWLLGNEPGYYIAGFTAQDFAEKINLALEFGKNTGRTKGRERIISLGLDSDSTANKIINIYKKVIKK